MFVVSRKVNMLSKVEVGEKREELRGEVVRRIIEMNVKVASDDPEVFSMADSRSKSTEGAWSHAGTFCVL